MQTAGQGGARTESELQSVRIAALIFGNGAITTFAVIAAGPVPGWSMTALAAFGSSAVAASLWFVVMWWRRMRVSTWAYFVFWLAGIAITSVGQLVTATPPSFAPMLAAILCMFGAGFLPRVLSIACVVFFSAAQAVVFWTQEGWDPPIAYWSVVTITAIMCTVAVGQLVNRAERETTRANAAVAELQTVNATLEDRVAAQLEEIRASRARIVSVADNERRRMERDLHDGAQQYLSLVGLQLASLARFIDSESAQAGTRLAEARSTLGAAQAELRNLAHGIYPAALEVDGVAEALREAAARSPVMVDVECDGVGRLPRATEAALYFCCIEALQNISKYAGPDASASVRLAQRGQRIEFAVTDTGAGFDIDTNGHGQMNMRDRIGALGGEITVISTPGAGTSVTGWVPAHSAV